MPQFTLADANGVDFSYKHGSNQILTLVFLSNQKKSIRAAEELKTILNDIEDKADSLDFVVVIEDPNAQGYLEPLGKHSRHDVRILEDKDYKLWGQLGVIATPTVVITGKDDTILWVKAGCGYDFLPSVKHNLAVALGLEKASEVSTVVKTVDNTTAQARLKRHLQMAKMLEKKGRLESAIQQINIAQQLDPNYVEASLALGKLYCKKGEPEKAIEAAVKLKPQNNKEKANANLILGWAKRQLGQLEEAEKLLLEATSLDRKSSRGFFELGKIYHAKGDKEKAIKAYRTSLDLIYEESPTKRISQY